MKKIIASLFLLTILINNLRACLNGDSKELKDGTVLYMDHEKQDVPIGHDFHEEKFAEALRNLESLYRKTKDLDYLSDKGLVLILMKRYDEAIELYLSIEKIRPGRYSTASNIGTAYELAGQNDNALKWIQKAVRINPQSHFRSEWIHVKILKAKIGGEKYYTSEFLLNNSFGTGVSPDSTLPRDKVQKLYSALYYQLNERITFVKPQDKLIGLLLFELGNMAYVQKMYSVARGDYELAKRYGYNDELLDKRLRQTYIATGEQIINNPLVKETASNLITKAKPVKKPPYLIYIGIGVTLLISVLLFVLYKKKFR